MSKEKAEKKNMYKEFVKLIFKEEKLILLTLLLAAVMCGVYQPGRYQPLDVIYAYLSQYFSQAIKDAIGTFFSIIIGLYVAVISIFATSTTGVGEKIVVGELDNSFIAKVMIGLISSLILVVFAMFVPDFRAYYFVLLGLWIAAMFSLIKFVVLLIVIFKVNMNSIAESIDARKSFESTLLSTLEVIKEELQRKEK